MLLRRMKCVSMAQLSTGVRVPESWHWCFSLMSYWNIEVGEKSVPGKMSSNAEAEKYGIARGKHHFIYGWNVRYGRAVKSYWCGFWSQAAGCRISCNSLTFRWEPLPSLFPFPHLYCGNSDGVVVSFQQQPLKPTRCLT